MAARPARASTGLRVGVTLHVRDGAQSLWENGIFQNCRFLLMLLDRAPAVDRAFLVLSGPGAAAPPAGFLAAFETPTLGMAEAMNALDVIIELSAQLDADWARSFAQRGGRIVGMRVANDYVIDAERMAFGLPPGILVNGAPIHEIWMLAGLAKSCGGYYEAAFRAPVRVMPHLWSPVLVKSGLAGSGTGRAFRYTPGQGRWRLGIFEPNLCSVKTCHVPLLLCEHAHRIDPQRIDYVRVFNALTIKENPQFVDFALRLDLVRQGIATFEGRFPIFEVLGGECDAIVSHHWLNPQNYLFYEALHGGFPLIHNSDMLGDCGYRYRSFDPEDGALALLQAMAEHDLTLDAYRARARRFLAGLDPLADANIRAFDAALTALVALEAAA